MAIINNNVQNVSFLRNQTPFESRELALSALENNKSNALDGSPLLARYTTTESGATVIKTLVGFVAVSGETKYLTVLDVEGASGDVEALRQQMLNTFGSGVTTANTATAQLEALSGNNESTSAETSVEGAKRYAEDLISTLDGGITAETGSYIASVSEVDGKISGTTAELPSIEIITEAGKPIIAIGEDKGTVAASAGTIDAQYVNIADSGEKFSATTVEGALAELDTKINDTIEGLDYTGVTTGDGVVITNVTENNGLVSAASANVGGLKLTDYTKGSDSGSVAATDSINQAFSKLENQVDAEKDARAAAIAALDYTDAAVAKKFVTSVSEENGVISVSRGEVTSTDKTVVLTDGSDGGIDLAVNIDNVTLEKNANGVISVTSSALVQYEGDGDTVQIGAVQAGVRTVSSPLTISATTPTDSNVREQYNLVGASGNTIGATIKIYKDSALYGVYLGHVDDTLSDNTDPTSIVDGTGDTALCFIYHKEDGTYELVTVNVEDFIEENEFASGVTWDSGATKVRGVVDPTSETFLTVGADGFKLSGVQNAIDTAVSGAVQTLDADESGSTVHITVNVVEENGVITGVNVEESDIASKTDIDALSAKTITEVTSSNASITAAETEAADGTTSLDIITDADKIKMSGFTADSTSSLSGIAESDSVATAFEKTNEVITENERVTAAALTDLDARTDEVSGKVDTIESQYVSGATMNGSGITVTNHVAAFSIESAPSANAQTSPITVTTADNGAVTLTFQNIDCGYYE